jgi:uncharacterized membrane protein
MVAHERIFAFTVMGSIIAFGFIHLGLSIGIIVPYRQYDDIFRPQIGLSSFNLVISILALFVGVSGVISLTAKTERFGRLSYSQMKSSCRCLIDHANTIPLRKIRLHA